MSIYKILPSITKSRISIHSTNPMFQIYLNVKKLGQGSYGTVYKVTHILTGKIRAMKVLQKSHVEHKERLRSEV